jgi:hypothetical protein
MSRDFHVYYGPAVVCGRVKRNKSVGFWGCPQCKTTAPGGDWKYCARCGAALTTGFTTEKAFTHHEVWIGQDVLRRIPEGDPDHYHGQDVLITNLAGDPWGVLIDPECDSVRIDRARYNHDGLLRDFERHYAREIAILSEKTGQAHVTWGLFVWSS